MPTHHPNNEYDAIVIGASYVGLSAALQLARARRRVLVVDAGQRRNRYARHLWRRGGAIVKRVVGSSARIVGPGALRAPARSSRRNLICTSALSMRC